MPAFTHEALKGTHPMPRYVLIAVVSVFALALNLLPGCDRESAPPSSAQPSNVPTQGSGTPKPEVSPAGSASATSAPAPTLKPPSSVPDAHVMLSEFEAAYDRFASTDWANEFKVDEAKAQYQREFDALTTKWTGQWVRVDLQVVAVGKGQVLLAAAGPADEKQHSARMVIGQDAFGRDDVGAFVGDISVANSPVLGWGKLPRDFSIEDAKQWSQGDRLSVTVLVRGAVRPTRSREFQIVWPILIGATWVTDSTSVMETLDPARAAQIRRENERKAKVAEVVKAVRERAELYRAETQPNRNRMAYEDVSAGIARGSSDEKPALMRLAIMAGRDIDAKAILDEIGRLDLTARLGTSTLHAIRRADSNGLTCLHYAVLMNRPAIVRDLIGSYLNPGDHTGSTRIEIGAISPLGNDREKTDLSVSALHLAAMFGRIECIELLLPSNLPQHAPWRVDENTRHPWRGWNGNTDRFLNGENPFRPEDAPEYTRSQWAPELDMQDQPAERSSGPADQHQPFGGTPPVFACHYTINEPDTFGLTPLDYARIFGQKEAEAQLLKAGAKGLLQPADIPALNP